MKIINLLNKIANGEIETYKKFQYRNKIVTMGYLLDNYLFLEILNDEIEFIEDKLEEYLIQKLEEESKNAYDDETQVSDAYITYEEILDKVRELKGSD